MSHTILCFSRSYLSRLLPELGRGDPSVEYLHIVQTDREAAHITSVGGTVVLNLQALVRETLTQKDAPKWKEPEDFRALTSFFWSPIYADRYLPEYTPVVRRKIAGSIFAALTDIFDRLKIDAFVSEPVALFTTHVAFYLCKKHGAKPLLWANAYFPGYFYFSDDVQISKPVRVGELTQAQRKAARASVSSYLTGVADDKRGPAYHHSFISQKLSKFSFLRQRRGLEPLVLRPGLNSKAIQVARLMRVTLSRLTFPWFSDFMTAGAVNEHRFYLRALNTSRFVYDKMPVEYSNSHVVYPLQYEPEASLLYFAPDFVSQVAFVETILRSLPDDHILWVKEHPNQFGALGERHWREMRRRYENLRLIQGRESVRELIRKSALVVAISSSAGMDALAIGRRVVVAGQVFYRHMTGALPVSSAAEIAAIVNDPSNYGPIDNFDKNIEELAQFASKCYRGDPQPAHELFHSENLNFIACAIRNEIGAA